MNPEKNIPEIQGGEACTFTQASGVPALALSDPRQTQDKGPLPPTELGGWKEGRRKLFDRKAKASERPSSSLGCKRSKCHPPLSLASSPGRLYTGAWGHCTGSNPRANYFLLQTMWDPVKNWAEIWD